MSYLSGVIWDIDHDINVAVFPNNKKQADNHPDYNIVISGARKKQEKPDDDEEEDAF